MTRQNLQATSRRRLLQFLAASPLLAHGALAQGARPDDPVNWAPRDFDKLIADPSQALDVFDFEPVMEKNVPPAHFGYMATGTDDELTLRANREGFRKFELRPRRLTDVSRIDTGADILGASYDSPIVIAPTGSNRAFHPDAEVAVAKAAKAGNHLQILSSVSNTSIEDAIAARGAPVWFQLYTTQRPEIGEALARRAEQAGAPVIVVTVVCDRRRSGKPLSGCGAPIRAIAEAAMAATIISAASRILPASRLAASAARPSPTSPGSRSSACAIR